MKRLIYIIRHPQTKYNVTDTFQGLSNSAITSDGRKQLANTLQYFQDKEISEIYSSPLSRCRYVAYEFAKLKHIRVQYDDLLKEVCYGRWDGKRKSGLVNDPEWTKKNKNRFTFRYPGSYKGHNGESYKDVYNRLKSFWKKISIKNQGNVLIIGHTGIMMAGKKYFEKLTDQQIKDYRPANGEILKYEIF